MSTRAESALDDLIFSVEDGIVWVNWASKSDTVELGHYVIVLSLMRQFLAQCDIGERLVCRLVGND